jgi:hypothetical protein
MSFAGLLATAVAVVAIIGVVFLVMWLVRRAGR